MNERKDTYGERKELSYGGGPKEAYGGSGQKEQYSISEFLTKMAQGEQVQRLWMDKTPILRVCYSRIKFGQSVD